MTNIDDLTNLILALPALVAAIGTLIASFRATRPANVATKDLANHAAPTVPVLAERARTQGPGTPPPTQGA